MNHKRVRTDTFDAPGHQLRVTGRQGYESSTDIWITREVEAEFEQEHKEAEVLTSFEMHITHLTTCTTSPI